MVFYNFSMYHNKWYISEKKFSKMEIFVCFLCRGKKEFRTEVQGIPGSYEIESVWRKVERTLKVKVTIPTSFSY